MNGIAYYRNATSRLCDMPLTNKHYYHFMCTHYQQIAVSYIILLHRNVHEDAHLCHGMTGESSQTTSLGSCKEYIARQWSTVDLDAIISRFVVLPGWWTDLYATGHITGDAVGKAYSTWLQFIIQEPHHSTNRHAILGIHFTVSNESAYIYCV